jgi:hypothetical protein
MRRHQPLWRLGSLHLNAHCAQSFQKLPSDLSRWHLGQFAMGPHHWCSPPLTTDFIAASEILKKSNYL